MIKVAVDWGSTSFRAYRFDNGEVTDQLEAKCGIKSVVIDNQNDSFESILHQQIGPWLTPGDDILLAGMITSVNGWKETPYICCPVDSMELSRYLTRLDTHNHTLYFTPGVSQQQPALDIMRGEEVQLLGLNTASQSTRQLVVLPGTHSKWALVEGSQLVAFRTVMTGELFSALLNHTLVGQMASAEDWCDSTFLNTVEMSYQNTNLISNLFSARSSVLLHTMQAAQVSAYLSGLLIGSEIREGASITDGKLEQITIVGSDSLTARYLQAARHLSIPAKPGAPFGDFPDVTAAGFAAIIGSVNRQHEHRPGI